MKTLLILLCMASGAFAAETKVTGNELSTASLSGTMQMFKATTLSAVSTITITGLQAGVHYRIFYNLTQNTSTGELRMLIASKTSSYCWATYGHNSAGTAGVIGAACNGTYWPLAYNGAITAVGWSTFGDWTLYLDGGGFPKLVGRGDRYTGSYIEQSMTYGDQGNIGVTTFPISIYTTGGTLTGTVYIQQFVP